MPAKQVSCPAFCGAGADRLAVTSGTQGLDKTALAANLLAGRTFLLPMPVSGRFDPPVRL